MITVEAGNAFAFSIVETGDVEASGFARENATASVVGIPLLKLDAGKLFGGLVGQSEAQSSVRHSDRMKWAPRPRL